MQTHKQNEYFEAIKDNVLNVSSVFDEESHRCDLMLQEIKFLVLFSTQNAH